MKTVVSLGQCAADHSSITRHLGDQFRVKVVAADTPAEALAALRRDPIALVLVNRVLDDTGESGLDFIRQLKADPTFAGTPVMLVSNYEDAQQEAVTAGALPGFGKAALRHPETADRLRAVLAGVSSESDS